MAEHRTLATIRRALAGLPDSDLLLDQQAGLVLRLNHAASLIGESVDDVASAISIGLLEARQMHEAGERMNFPVCFLAVLRAARTLGLRQSGASFTRCGRSALAVSLNDGIERAEQAHYDDPALILEACQTVHNLDLLQVSSELAGAERDSIASGVIAGRCGITTRAARYRKARARAVSVVQGDLFGGLL